MVELAAPRPILGAIVDPAGERVVETVARTEPLAKSILSTRGRVQALPIVPHGFNVSPSTATTVTIVTPPQGMKVRLTYVHITALGVVKVFLQFKGSHPGLRITPSNMVSGSVMNANLVGTNFEGDPDEVLEVVTSAAVAVDVFVIVEFIAPSVVAEEDSD